MDLNPNSQPDPEYGKIIGRFLDHWETRLRGKTIETQVEQLQSDLEGYIKLLKDGMRVSSTAEQALELALESYGVGIRRQKEREWITLLLIGSRWVDQLEISKQIEYLLVRGRLYRRVGEQQLALQDHEAGERLAQDAGLIELQAAAWSALAHDYFEQKAYGSALDYAQRAVDAPSHSAYEAILALTMLGLTQLELEQAPLAIPPFMQAIALLKESDRWIDLAHTYNNLGRAYQGMHHFSSAYVAFHQAINLFKVHGMLVEQARVMFNLAGMAYAELRFQPAIDALDQINLLGLARLGESQLHGQILHGYGEIYRRLHKLDESRDYLLAAIRQWEQIDESILLGSSCLSLAEVEWADNRVDYAVAYISQGVSALQPYAHVPQAQRHLDALETLRTQITPL